MKIENRIPYRILVSNIEYRILNIEYLNIENRIEHNNNNVITVLNTSIEYQICYYVVSNNSTYVGFDRVS